MLIYGSTVILREDERSDMAIIITESPLVMARAYRTPNVNVYLRWAYWGRRD